MIRTGAIAGLAGVALAAQEPDVTGGTLKLAYSDCGDKTAHGKFTSLSPTTVNLGTKTPLKGKGIVDEDIQGASYEVQAKALGITVFKHSGDACKAESIKLPAGAGSIDMHGFKCPLAKGDVELDLDLNLAGSIPASLARLTIDLKAQTNTGDKALCAEIKTSPSAGETGEASFADSSKPDYDGLWKEFKKKFSMEFKKHEEQMRFAIFKANVDRIEAVNSKPLSYTLGITQFAHLTADEFAHEHTGFKKPQSMWGDLPYLGRHTHNGTALAAGVDWTKKGAVTPVKNQRQCGSCWAFSTTDALEGAWEIATGKLVSISEQQFVDCDHVDMGCGGGTMDTAFTFAEKNDLCTEQSYPYDLHAVGCRASGCKVGIPKGAVKGYKDVSKDNEQALMSAVAHGPVSIAIEADKSVFQLYRSGVLNATCGDQLDHGVLAVGYGTDPSGTDYWLVKNSWGMTWGDNGYVKLLRGKDGPGECGLLKQASYPVVDGKAPHVPQSEVVV